MTFRQKSTLMLIIITLHKNVKLCRWLNQYIHEVYFKYDYQSLILVWYLFCYLLFITNNYTMYIMPAIFS